MNKTEFQSLPPDLQRDVRLAVAIGWPLESLSVTKHGFAWIDVPCGAGWSQLQQWRPTTDRTIWAGLLEAFRIDIARPSSGCAVVWFTEKLQPNRRDDLPTAIVCEVIRRDPLGHLARIGL